MHLELGPLWEKEEKTHTEESKMSVSFFPFLEKMKFWIWTEYSTGSCQGRSNFTSH